MILLKSFAAKDNSTNFEFPPKTEPPVRVYDLFVSGPKESACNVMAVGSNEVTLTTSEKVRLINPESASRVN